MKIIIVQNSYNEIPEEDRGRIGPDDRILTIRHKDTWQIIGSLDRDLNIPTYISPHVHHIPWQVLARLAVKHSDLHI